MAHHFVSNDQLEAIRAIAFITVMVAAFNIIKIVGQLLADHFE